MEYMKNTSYFFVPFKYEKYERFKDLTRMLDESDSWDLVHDEIIYMMKYVADKLDSRKPEQCLCFHYEWNGRKREDFSGLKDWFSTKKHPFQGTEISFRFQLIGIQLYCFSTSVCIMVFQVQFEKNDPNYIASAEYYLKKVGREKIFSDQNPNEITFLKIAEKLMREVEEIGTFDYFYYANPSTERANVLSYLEMEKKEDYREDLFFLRYCYSEGFLYTEDQEREKKEINQSSHDMIWGVSQEAAVCITCPEMGRGTFIRTTFYRNFNYQYLYMYILLLHQKYVLYMFLTEIGVGRYNTLETLEEYRRRLYEFEADFVFSCVTEVAQYQRLYDRMTDVFALKDMYEDVNEPIRALTEERKRETEEEQKSREAKLNRSLLFLSILSVFSALIDSFDFSASFLGGTLKFGPAVVHGVQGVCILLIFSDCGRSFEKFIRFKKRKTERIREKRGKGEFFMWEKYHYIGCFFATEDFYKKVKKYRKNPLEQQIEIPHITFSYKPDKVEESLFGTAVRVWITGYGNDGRNEGLKVKLECEDPVLQKMAEQIKIPHITLAVSKGEKAVNTSRLKFEPVEPMELESFFGGCTEEKRVIGRKRL